MLNLSPIEKVTIVAVLLTRWR